MSDDVPDFTDYPYYLKHMRETKAYFVAHYNDLLANTDMITERVPSIAEHPAFIEDQERAQALALHTMDLAAQLPGGPLMADELSTGEKMVVVETHHADDEDPNDWDWTRDFLVSDEKWDPAVTDRAIAKLKQKAALEAMQSAGADLDACEAFLRSTDVP